MWKHLSVEQEFSAHWFFRVWDLVTNAQCVRYLTERCAGTDGADDDVCECGAYHDGSGHDGDGGSWAQDWIELSVLRQGRRLTLRDDQEQETVAAVVLRFCKEDSWFARA